MESRRNLDAWFPRVLLVGPALKGGGAENRFRLASQYLFGGEGASVAVFKNTELDEVWEARSSIDLKWRGPHSYLSMIARLRWYLGKNKFDAVMAFGFYPNLVAWAAVQGMRRKPALVLSEINSMRKEYLEVRGTLRGPLLERLRRTLYRRADMFAANSQDGLSDAIRYYKVEPKRARRIPNLVDVGWLRGLANQALEKSHDVKSPVICIVGRLFKRKRVDTLIKAVSGLSHGLGWCVEVVGDGEDRAKLEKMAIDLGVGDRVRFRGWQENPYPHIARATISVLCSEFEGFPNTVLESMALGIPVVTSLNTSDALEMCASGAALGFPIGDHEQLRHHLENLLENQLLREQLKSGAETYVSRHLLPTAIGEYETLVIDAVKNKAESRFVPTRKNNPFS